MATTTTILERCKISPPADSVPEFTLPILFFDMIWYDFAANQSVLFFEFPAGCSKSHFMDSIVPQLKTSLSLTLSHFLPLAGNIIHPAPLNLTGDNNNNNNNNNNMKPVIRYESGDSVSLTISESTADFNHLTGNHPRASEDFYAFAPQLSKATHSEYSITCPVLALQVTLFPGKGLCIGFVTHHAVADASTVVSFIQAWALINSRSDDGEDNNNKNNILAHELLKENNNCLPFYDRKAVINLNGLDSLYWDLIVKFASPVEPPPVKLPINKLRSTFVMKKDEIQKLKNLLLAKCPGLGHLSSFTVICALVWVCSAKTAAFGGDDVADDESEYFGFVADCRGRLNPPLPANYFGNCVALVMAVLKHGEVIKGIDDGFVMAAKAIGEAIKENVYNEKGILYDAENWPEEYGKLIGKRQYSVAGSPRFDFYAADYGWGKPNKFEALFIDSGETISLCKSREFHGGLEIGVSKPKVLMDAFTTVFAEVLTNLLQ
ncbi:hypothetical protein BUALT_Bualt14G0003200 [Buddleja alternifolia]|uniref:Uncharacterized protein n=1 Tax=Buddleja alternifolia TaxID=168488 RepID=A0AAV6WQX1_9LAMI|nr:hypothetical protein BUALT_Bualt14G0003200 [Buddleja alternifolia]